MRFVVHEIRHQGATLFQNDVCVDLNLVVISFAVLTAIAKIMGRAVCVGHVFIVGAFPTGDSLSRKQIASNQTCVNASLLAATDSPSSINCDTFTTSPSKTAWCSGGIVSSAFTTPNAAIARMACEPRRAADRFVRKRDSSNLAKLLSSTLINSKSNDHYPSENERRRIAALKRAAREKLERIEAAQFEVEDMQEKYKKRSSSEKRSEPRASTTDPEARQMKMGDNGTRPAMNVPFASDGDAKMVVAVDVTSQGSDNGLMKPMYDDVADRYGVTPKEYLVDGGFSKKEDITYVEQQGTEVLAPLYAEQKQLDAGKDPYAARAKESAEMTAHRQRMGTDDAKERYRRYRRRSAIAAYPNADCRNRGLTQFRVRGLVKSKAQALWHVLAFNLMRMKNLYCPLREQSYLEFVMGS